MGLLEISTFFEVIVLRSQVLIQSCEEIRTTLNLQLQVSRSALGWAFPFLMTSWVWKITNHTAWYEMWTDTKHTSSSLQQTISKSYFSLLTVFSWVKAKRPVETSTLRGLKRHIPTKKRSLGPEGCLPSASLVAQWWWPLSSKGQFIFEPPRLHFYVAWLQNLPG